MQQIFYDWQTLIAAVMHWMAGGDPYGPYAHISGQLKPAGAFAYPPAFLLVAAPLALLPWQLSGALVVLATVVLFEYWVRQTTGRVGLIWLVLWLPLCQGLWLGQTTLLTVALLAVAELMAQRRRDRLAGVLVALALLKPQTLALPAAYMLIQAARERRLGLLGAWGAAMALLWGGAALAAGPQIYAQWAAGLRAYGPELSNRPLIFPPLGPALAALAALLWWRHGRKDPWGALLLLNTLVYPLSVVYVAAGLAFVVVRWRPRWPHYPLLLSWLIPMLAPLAVRTPDTIAAQTQAITATALLAGLLPAIPLPPLRRRAAPAADETPRGTA